MILVNTLKLGGLSMKREEAIKKLESLKISLPAAKSEISEIVELLKSPWISIKDDLPCNHKELTPKDYTVEVLTLDDCNSYRVVRMWKFHDKWVWGLDDLPITHWMRLPEPPKE